MASMPPLLLGAAFFLGAGRVVDFINVVLCRGNRSSIRLQEYRVYPLKTIRPSEIRKWPAAASATLPAMSLVADRQSREIFTVQPFSMRGKHDIVFADLIAIGQERGPLYYGFELAHVSRPVVAHEAGGRPR